MNIYRIWQEVNNDYDTYDSAVVVAKNEEDARNMAPDGDLWIEGNGWCHMKNGELLPNNTKWGDWCDPKDVQVELMGTTVLEDYPRGVILSSYNAG